MIVSPSREGTISPQSFAQMIAGVQTTSPTPPVVGVGATNTNVQEDQVIDE